MSNEIPQDLTSSLSVLYTLRDYAISINDTEFLEKINEFINAYDKTVNDIDESDLTTLPYNRKDATSILEYLKLQAEQLSNGRWTDFSDSDIGTVFLKLMSYLSDMNNYQVDKVASELYLKTVTERANGVLLSSLLGYEPRHYNSAYSDLTLTNVNNSITNGTVIPKYSVFTDSESNIQYTTLEDYYIYDNKCKLRAYQGNPVTLSYNINNVTSLGRIALPSYYIGVNTVQLNVNGTDWNRVDDVRFVTGDLAFSVHISENQYLYIQLPAYWTDLITSGSVIRINYLISAGESGRIGKNTLTRINIMNSNERNNIKVISNTSSEGGYNPETVDELRISLPKHARTMNTIVTIKDFEEVGTNVLGISDISALDYNDPSSGLIQPDDYYKVQLYVLPDADNYDATNTESTKYRNTIIKSREDWIISDVSNVAKDVVTKSQSTIGGNVIQISGLTSSYNEACNIIPCIDTGLESTSTVIPLITGDFSETEVQCKIAVDTTNDYITITLNSNWRELVNDTDKISIYFKQDQILTERGQALREYIDDRRLASLNVTYHNLDIVQPTISIDVYMDKNDIHFNIASSAIKEFIINKYSRTNIKIGEPIFASVIGADILTAFNYVRYCEVRNPEELIEVTPKGFIDVVPNVLVNEVLVDKITVNVYDYQNRII